ncbi:hypothetical protein SAMN02745249_00237 [Atopostipes suicloacalis DSM 15692]|uniref:Uncharacterized protein n=1 Tax=Atopostipes suicloacalis DSM 15692 TaxID=1121025 RepID=A0A1M4SN47_9LACT|nr:hypothetical protein [Atopostipes suicloacalis]SHE33625.1 hypothetical protein SAMN02745249_00237 [Atopostipes suicloacalis DSM 15692]
MNKIKNISISLLFTLFLNIVLPIGSVKAASKEISDPIITFNNIEYSLTENENNEFILKNLVTGTEDILTFSENKNGINQVTLNESTGEQHVIENEIKTGEVTLDSQDISEIESSIITSEPADFSLSRVGYSWKYIRTQNSNTNVAYRKLSLIVSIILAITPVSPSVGVATAVAQYIIDNNLKTLYTQRKEYYRSDKTNIHKYKVSYYKYSNYTGLIRSTSYTRDIYGNVHG